MLGLDALDIEDVRGGQGGVDKSSTGRKETSEHTSIWRLVVDREYDQQFLGQGSGSGHLNSANDNDGFFWKSACGLLLYKS